MSKLMSFIKDEEGQGMVEYGLIIGLVAVVLITVIGLFGGKIETFFTNANGRIPSGAAN